MKIENLRLLGCRYFTDIQAKYMPQFELPFGKSFAEMRKQTATISQNRNSYDDFPAWRAQELKANSNYVKGQANLYLSELDNLPHQEPRAYTILRGHQDAIEHVMRPMFGPVAPKVVIVGTIPRGLVNASVIPTEHPDCFIIAFEFGLVKFFSHLCYSIARLVKNMPPEVSFHADDPTPDTCHRILRADPQALDGFLPIMKSFLATGGIIYSRGVSKDPELYDLAMAFRVSTELWCLGHEYSHLWKGHLGQRRTVQTPAHGAYEEVASNHNQEHEADGLGLTPCLALSKLYFPQVPYGSYVGGEIFCLTDLMINRSICLIQHQSPEVWSSDTHPNPRDRIRYMRERLVLVLSEAFQQQAIKPALEFANKVRYAFLALQYGWEEVLQEKLLGQLVLAPQFANRHSSSSSTNSSGDTTT
jgi:hypothetical protein